MPMLTPAERDVLFALRECSFSPVASDLTRATNMTTRSVSAYLGRLCTKGFVYSHKAHVYYQYPRPHNEVETRWRITAHKGVN